MDEPIETVRQIVEAAFRKQLHEREPNALKATHQPQHHEHVWRRQQQGVPSGR